MHCALDVESDDLRRAWCGARCECGLGVGPLIHRDTLAIEEVVVRVGLAGGDRQAGLRVAQDLDPLVDEVRAGGGGAPGVVDPASELDVGVGAREGRTPSIHARTMHILLVQDLGREVGDLGAEDRNRMAPGAMSRIHQQGVAQRHPARYQLGQVHVYALPRRDSCGRPRLLVTDVVTAAARRGEHVGDARQVGLGAVDVIHIRKGLLKRRWGERIVLLPHVTPNRQTPLRPERLGQGFVEQPALDLPTAADGEDRLDDRRHCHHVGGCPLARHLLPSGQGRVLDRHLVGGVSDRVRDVRVDAADVVGAVVVDLLTLGRAAERRGVPLGQKVCLIGQLRVAVSGHLRDRAVLVDGGLRRPDELRQTGPPNMPQCIHHEEAVMRGRVADAELRVGTCAAVDVRDPEALVPDDVRAIVRRRERLHLADVRRRDGEACVLVVAAER